MPRVSDASFLRVMLITLISHADADTFLHLLAYMMLPYADTSCFAARSSAAVTLLSFALRDATLHVVRLLMLRRHARFRRRARCR